MGTPKRRQLLIGITGRTRADWQLKFSEIRQYGVGTAALFLEHYPAAESRRIVAALPTTPLRRIPLVHLRSDTPRDILRLLYRRYRTRYFTIHESHFRSLPRWRGYHQHLYLEMTSDDYVAPSVRVERIGGFCVDLAHFQREMVDQIAEYRYVVERLGGSPCRCNHISGYSTRRNRDLHLVTNVREFNYLAALPRNLFGSVMAIEVFNSIRQQLRYREHLRRYLAHTCSIHVSY